MTCPNLLCCSLLIVIIDVYVFYILPDSLKAYMEKHGGEVEKVELKYDKVTQRMR